MWAWKTLTPDFGTETEGRKADKGTPTESGDVVSVDASKVERIVLECGTCAGFLATFIDFGLGVQNGPTARPGQARQVTMYITYEVVAGPYVGLYS